MNAKDLRFRFLRWLVWTLAILFLFYEFFLRVYPSVMVDELKAAFSVDDLALGTLSAFYFYAYAPMQLPVGILMDRFGARKLLTFASLICGLGSLLFAVATQLPIAELGRFFMGIGSAFAFIGMVYISSHWFPKERLALLIGVGNSIGMLGAAAGEGPLSIVVTHIGWRATVFIFALVGLALAFIIFLLMRNEPPSVQKSLSPPLSFIDALKQFKAVCSNGCTWFNAIAALCIYLTTGTFAGLWAVPFLETVHHITKEPAAFAVTILFIGWIAGGPVLGQISDRLSRRKPTIYLSALGMLLCLLPLIYIPMLSITLIYLLFFLIGFFSAGQLLNFSLAIEMNDILAKGSAIAITNCVVAIGASVMQPLVGYLLDLHAGIGLGKLRVPELTASDYQFAMVVFPISCIIALLVMLPIRERAKKT